MRHTRVVLHGLLHLGLVPCVIASMSIDAAAAPPPARTDGMPIGGTAPVEIQSPERCEGVRLSLRTRSNLEGGVTFIGALFNDGPRTVTLVDPGDGSAAGWRTPILTWKVTTPDGTPVAEYESPRCGNMNAIHSDEIFDLPPHRHHVLSAWIGAPQVATAGRYVIRVTYQNHPGLRPLHGASETVLRRMANSTPCTVESDAVTVDLPGVR